MWIRSFSGSNSKYNGPTTQALVSSAQSTSALSQPLETSTSLSTNATYGVLTCSRAMLRAWLGVMKRSARTSVNCFSRAARSRYSATGGGDPPSTHTSSNGSVVRSYNVSSERWVVTNCSRGTNATVAKGRDMAGSPQKEIRTHQNWRQRRDRACGGLPKSQSAGAQGRGFYSPKTNASRARWASNDGCLRT